MRYARAIRQNRLERLEIIIESRPCFAVVSLRQRTLDASTSPCHGVQPRLGTNPNAGRIAQSFFELTIDKKVDFIEDIVKSKMEMLPLIVRIPDWLARKNDLYSEFYK